MRKAIPFGQLAFASIVGIITGTYIFHPSYFVTYQQSLDKGKATDSPEQVNVKKEE